jgi:hypothetical protein
MARKLELADLFAMDFAWVVGETAWCVPVLGGRQNAHSAAG